LLQEFNDLPIAIISHLNEYFFSMYTHPNEYQNRELSETTGLTAQQVKFWFQNKITQIKVWSKNFNLQNLNYTVCCHLPRHPSAILHCPMTQIAESE
jgi:hypothetical protein